jgi:hypothetical protein
MVRENGERVFLEKVRNEEIAKLKISKYYREDRYEHEVEGYAKINVRYEYE